MQAGPQKILRYLGAYTGLFVFAFAGLAISWGLRSDIFLLSTALSVPQNITNFLFTWTTPIVILPWILVCVGLEHYMNEAARNGLLLPRALKVLSIEAVIAVGVLAIMGGLALAGYPPTW